MAMASVHALLVPAFWPIDELANVGYARLLLAADLPTIDTPAPDDGIPGLEGRLFYERRAGNTQRFDAWTANHPPLAYVLAGAPLALGVAVGQPGLGMFLARLVSVAATGLAVVAVALLTDALLPRAEPGSRAAAPACRHRRRRAAHRAASRPRAHRGARLQRHAGVRAGHADPGRRDPGPARRTGPVLAGADRGLPARPRR